MTTQIPDSDDYLLELSELACNGLLDAEGYVQLDEVLSSNVANQKTYLEYVHLYSSLERMAVQTEPRLLFQKAQAKNQQQGRTFIMTLLAVAASVALVWLGVFNLQNRQTELAGLPLSAGVATVAGTSSDALWKIDQRNSSRTILKNQIVQVLQGYLEIRFHNGTLLVAKGPADFLVTDELNVNLVSGTLRTTLEGATSEFKVVTNSMEIVDRGTQFYVEVAADGLTTSYVSEGICDIRSRVETEVPSPFLTVEAGECVLVDHDWELVPLNPELSRSFSERMVSSFLSYDLRIPETSPSVCLISPPEVELNSLFCSANRPVYLIPEKQQVRLEHDLVLPGGNGVQPVTLSAGTYVDSFLLHNAFGPNLPAATSRQILRQVRTSGHIVFAHEVLAVVNGYETLSQTDRLFAPRGLRLPNEQQRALEETDRLFLSAERADRIDFEFHSAEGDFDQVRILVRSAVSAVKNEITVSN